MDLDRKDSREERRYRDREYERNRSDRNDNRRRSRSRSVDRNSERDRASRSHNDRERGSYSTHTHTRHSHSHTKTAETDHYALPTTESLKNKKLAALDHETFLMSRQKERDAVPLENVKDFLWPRTPPHGVFEFDFSEVAVGCEEENYNEAVSVNSANSANSTVSSESPTNTTRTLDEDEFGPSLVIKTGPSASNSSKSSSSNLVFSSRQNYGGDMMPGEGTAMAGFVAQGQRIPRRGEIGLDSDQISRFESAGYVMSGSRHHLMNAVRMRKENQVISVEEKKMISQMALEERIKREEEIIKTFKSMVDEKLKQQNK